MREVRKQIVKYYMTKNISLLEKLNQRWIKANLWQRSRGCPQTRFIQKVLSLAQEKKS